VINAAEVPAVGQGLDSLLPPWAQQLSLLTLLLAIIFGWLRGYVVSRAQNERDLAAERKIAEIWKANYEKAAEINQNLAQALDPVLKMEEAILKSVEGLQDDRERLRNIRRDRDR